MSEGLMKLGGTLDEKESKQTADHRESASDCTDPEKLAAAASISSTEVEGKPWFVYPLLAAAIVAVSSAAVAFSSMSEIQPFTLAAWRLQLTALSLLPLGAYSFWKMTSEEKQQTLKQAHLICASGVLLGCHFGLWVICIEHTSLPHALLAGSSPPVFIALGALILRKPISKGELIGTGIGAVGMLLISRGAQDEKAVSIYGDVMGYVAAIFFVVYLTIGRTVRTWMPIFAYVLPVNAIAALVLSSAALATEGAGVNRTPNGIFGQYCSWHYLWRSAYLGVVPGILGHVSFNALLKWLHPLLIALPGSSEPLIGTAIGLLFGIGTLPGVFTYIGGFILIASTIIVIMAAYKREKGEQAKTAEGAEIGLVEVSAEAAMEAEAGLLVLEEGPDEEEALLAVETKIL